MHFEVTLSNLLMLGITGSHAYGTATPESDIDRRGVVLTPLRMKVTTSAHFEQLQGDVPELRTLFREYTRWTDCTIFDAVKACHLIAQCNPNMMELLWLPEGCMRWTSPGWERLVAIRSAFLSTKAKHTYSGYAFAQWRKIRSHRSWLLDPPKAQPTRADFGLPEMSPLPADDRNRIEESIESMLRSWGIEDLVMDGAERDVLRQRMEGFYVSVLSREARNMPIDTDMRTLAGEALGLSSTVLEVLRAERAYRAALKHWQSYLRWKAERNPVRAELESRFGFDTKHAMHLIRLLRMGREVLAGEGVKVHRDDAEHLLAIRRGAWSYDAVDETAHQEMLALETAAQTSPLPRTPDIATIDRTICDIYGVQFA